MREVCGISLVQSLFSFGPKQGKIPIIGPGRGLRHRVIQAFSKGTQFQPSVLEVTSARRGFVQPHALGNHCERKTGRWGSRRKHHPLSSVFSPRTRTGQQDPFSQKTFPWRCRRDLVRQTMREPNAGPWRHGAFERRARGSACFCGNHFLQIPSTCSFSTSGHPALQSVLGAPLNQGDSSLILPQPLPSVPQLPHCP